MHSLDIEARDKFLFTLTWLLAVTKRSSGSFRFGLAHIGYENPKLLGETYGAKIASNQLDEVSHSLRKAFRKTDLVARNGSDFWVIVPFSPDIETINDKIKHISEIAKLAGLQIVERDISFFLLPLNNLPLSEDCDALEFLEYLKNNHASLSTREVVLPAST
jgi:GGDEF domain-containing protein